MSVPREQIRELSRFFIAVNDEDTPQTMVEALVTQHPPDWRDAYVIVTSSNVIRAYPLADLAILLQYLGPDAYTMSFATLPLLELTETMDRVETIGENDTFGDVVELISSYTTDNLDHRLALVDAEGFLGYFVEFSSHSSGQSGTEFPVPAEPRDAFKQPSRSLPRPTCPCPSSQHPKNLTATARGSTCPTCAAEWDQYDILTRAGNCPQ